MGFEKNRLQRPEIIADKNPFSEKNRQKNPQKIPQLADFWHLILVSGHPKR
jgi:hypothetical protein